MISYIYVCIYVYVCVSLSLICCHIDHSYVIIDHSYLGIYHILQIISCISHNKSCIIYQISSRQTVISNRVYKQCIYFVILWQKQSKTCTVHILYQISGWISFFFLFLVASPFLKVPIGPIQIKNHLISFRVFSGITHLATIWGRQVNTAIFAHRAHIELPRGNMICQQLQWHGIIFVIDVMCGIGSLKEHKVKTSWIRGCYWWSENKEMSWMDLTHVPSGYLTEHLPWIQVF